MPVGKPRIDHLVDPNRVHRVGDVEEDAIAGAGAGRQPDLRRGGDVVAPVGLARTRGGGTVIAAPPQAGDVAGLGVPEDEGPTDDAGRLGVRQRNLNDVDPEQRRVLFSAGDSSEQPASSSPDRTEAVPDP